MLESMIIFKITYHTKLTVTNIESISMICFYILYTTDDKMTANGIFYLKLREYNEKSFLGYIWIAREILYKTLYKDFELNLCLKRKFRYDKHTLILRFPKTCVFSFFSHIFQIYFFYIDKLLEN
jgi:hypothetical protein